MQLIELIKKNPDLLKSIRQGVEKEGLRCLEDKSMSFKTHPKSLGSKLTHPFITTDYSENLMEFISPVFDDCLQMFDFLRELFSYTYHNLDEDEVIWPWSMPCLLPDDEMSIPVANFGRSNVGQLKSLYRVGLGHRYGKSMQSIAGIHYNFSFSMSFWQQLHQQLNDSRPLQKFIDDKYFHLIRNYRRYSWLLIYLFGSTPVVHAGFLKGKKHKLQKLGKETFGLPYATSLRMGGLGYTSNAQKEISVCYNHLETYIQTLELARLKSYPPYEKIGLKDVKGYKQLNTNLLQIDNEFYSTLRPKRPAQSKESALQALHRRGMEYIEVRLLDVDPFVDTGISRETVKFLHVFLISCLLDEAPIISDQECDEIDANLLTVVNEGRRPDVKLLYQGEEKSLKDCAIDILTKMQEKASLLDQAYQDKVYSQSLEIQKQKVLDPTLTPSAKVLDLVSEDQSVIEGIYQLAKDYKNKHLKIKLNQEKQKKWDKLTFDSLEEQKSIEQSDYLSFDEFHAQYFNNIKINFGE